MKYRPSLDRRIRRSHRGRSTCVLFASAALACLAVQGCSGGFLVKKSATTTTTTALPTTTTVHQSDLARPFFEAFAEQTTSGFERMKGWTMAPDSPSADFTYHEQRVFQAKAQAGLGRDFYTVQQDGDNLLVCRDVSCNNFSRFSNFDVSGNSVFAFTIDGTDVSRAISTWPDKDAGYACYWFDNSKSCFSASAYIITVRSMYRTALGDLQITFDSVRGAESTETVDDDMAPINGVLTSTSYIDSGGAHSAASEWVNPIPEPGQSTIGTATFRDVPTGDFTLVINMMLNGYKKPFSIKFTGV